MSNERLYRAKRPEVDFLEALLPQSESANPLAIIFELEAGSDMTDTPSGVSTPPSATAQPMRRIVRAALLGK